MWSIHVYNNCVIVCAIFSSGVLWVHTLLSLLYLIITTLFMIHYSLQLGKYHHLYVHMV